MRRAATPAGVWGALGVVPGSVWACLVLAFLLRIGALIVSPDYVPLFDAAEHQRIAASLAAGSGYPESPFVQEGGPSAFTAPGYPGLLAILYWVVGDSVTAGRILQAVIGTACVALLSLIAAQIWGRRAAVVTAFVAAVCPFLIAPGLALLSEPLFIFFVLASISAALHGRRSANRARWAIGVGVLLGLAILVRPNGLPVVLALAFAFWPANGASIGRRLLEPAIVVAAVLVVLSPWIIRNAVVLGELTLSTRDGQAIARTYNEVAELSDPPSLPHDSPASIEVTETPGISEAEATGQLRTLGLEYARDHPLYVAKTAARNTLRALHLQDREIARISIVDGSGEGIPEWFGPVTIVTFVAVVMLALIGALAGGARQAPLFFWLVPVLLWLSVVWMADGRVRYRSPVDPFVVILATLGVLWLSDQLLTRRARGSDASC